MTGDPLFAPETQYALLHCAERLADLAAARCLPLFRSPGLVADN